MQPSLRRHTVHCKGISKRCLQDRPQTNASALLTKRRSIVCVARETRDCTAPRRFPARRAETPDHPESYVRSPFCHRTDARQSFAGRGDCALARHRGDFERSDEPRRQARQRCRRAKAGIRSMSKEIGLGRGAAEFTTGAYRSPKPPQSARDCLARANRTDNAAQGKQITRWRGAAEISSAAARPIISELRQFAVLPPDRGRTTFARRGDRALARRRGDFARSGLGASSTSCGICRFRRRPLASTRDCSHPRAYGSGLCSPLAPLPVSIEIEQQRSQRAISEAWRTIEGCSPPVPYHPHLEPGVQEGRLPGPSGASAWERTPARKRRGNLASSIGSKSVWATRTPQGTLKLPRGPARFRTAFPVPPAPGRSRTAYRRFYAARMHRQWPRLMQKASKLPAPALRSRCGARAADRGRC